MTGPTDRITVRHGAIAAGVSLVMMAVAAVFATDFVMGRLEAAGDPAATAANIRASEGLFRAGIFGWLVVLLCDVLAAWGLYVFLEPVSRRLSLLAGWLRLVYAAMLGAAVYNYVHILMIIDPEHAAAFEGVRQAEQVWLRLTAFSETWLFALGVFGLHLIVLGWLALRSGYVPKVFGILILIAGFGYLINYSTDLMAPGMTTLNTVLAWTFLVPQVAGEIGLAIWLLIKGWKVEVQI
jgi:hypothetical protein